MTVFHAFSSFLFKQFQTAFLLSFMHFHHFSIVVACVFFHITVVSLFRLLCSIPSFILWILMLSLFVVCVLIPTGSSSQDWESVLGLFSRFVLFFFSLRSAMLLRLSSCVFFSFHLCSFGGFFLYLAFFSLCSRAVHEYSCMNHTRLQSTIVRQIPVHKPPPQT